MSDTSKEEPAPRCFNLSCKSMAVYGESFEMDPEYQESETDFWCICTSKGYGPDGGEATLGTCRDRERKCYQEY